MSYKIHSYKVTTDLHLRKSEIEEEITATEKKEKELKENIKEMAEKHASDVLKDVKAEDVEVEKIFSNEKDFFSRLEQVNDSYSEAKDHLARLKFVYRTHHLDAPNPDEIPPYILGIFKEKIKERKEVKEKLEKAYEKSEEIQKVFYKFEEENIRLGLLYVSDNNEVLVSSSAAQRCKNNKDLEICLSKYRLLKKELKEKFSTITKLKSQLDKLSQITVPLVP